MYTSAMRHLKLSGLSDILTDGSLRTRRRDSGTKT